MLDPIWELISGAQKFVAVLYFHKEVKKNNEVAYELTEVIKGLNRFQYNSKLFRP